MLLVYAPEGSEHSLLLALVLCCRRCRRCMLLVYVPEGSEHSLLLALVLGLLD